MKREQNAEDWFYWRERYTQNTHGLRHICRETGLSYRTVRRELLAVGTAFRATGTHLPWKEPPVAPPARLICSICKKRKKSDQFERNSRLVRRGGRGYRCKPCAQRKTAGYNQQRKAHMPKGVTYEATYDKLFTAQNGKCAICQCTQPGKRRKRLCIDHCHATNKIRGLLCNTCNTALGFFKDNPVLLAQAIVYLKQAGTIPESWCA